MRGSHNSTIPKILQSKRATKIFAMCSAVREIEPTLRKSAAQKLILEGKTVKQVRALLWERLLNKQEPVEIDNRNPDREFVRELWRHARRFGGGDDAMVNERIRAAVSAAVSENPLRKEFSDKMTASDNLRNTLALIDPELKNRIDFEVSKALHVQKAYDLIASPKTRKSLLRAIRSRSRSAADISLLIKVSGIYRLVHLDCLDESGRYPRDIVEYLLSEAWLRKFKPLKSGPTRQAQAAHCAIRLASLFKEYLGSPCWDLVAEIINDKFPVFEAPKLQTTGKESLVDRRRRWIKKIARRYADWAQQFRPKIREATRSPRVM